MGTSTFKISECHISLEVDMAKAQRVKWSKKWLFYMSFKKTLGFEPKVPTALFGGDGAWVCVCCLKYPGFVVPYFNFYNYFTKMPFWFLPHTICFWNSCLMAIGVPLLGCYGCGCPFLCSVFSACFYRTFGLLSSSFAQISFSSFLYLLDRHQLLWDSEFQLFAWTRLL